MQDTLEITLPISGKKVELRCYTTMADDIAASAELTAGVNQDPETGTITYPVINILNHKQCYVRRLINSIDSVNTDLGLAIGALRSQDYAAIEAEVDKIISINSPKAIATEQDSGQDTATK